MKKKIKKPGFWYVCLSCGRTVSNVNKDGECHNCVSEFGGFRI